METYFETNKEKDCNGCGVCALKCPKNAIEMCQNGEGFLYPKIDYSKCVNCGLCRRICPNKETEKVIEGKAYIAINKNKDDLEKSSSGGCFIALAKYIISKKGIVFGVKYDDKLNAKHDYTDAIEGLTQFQGSKYVRSDINNSYQKAKEFLEDDRYVLFSGTPCQCEGLRAFLSKEYEKLYTCEIICHSNPSPKVFKLYKEYIEKKKNKKIKDIKFRAKETGWKNQRPLIVFDDNSTYEEEIFFYSGFVKELLNRPSCHNCYFCSSNRRSDFTIGDAWGINKIDNSIKDDDTGISLLCVSSKKGEKLLEELNNELFLRKTDKELAFSFNHHKNISMHKNRNKFYNGIIDGKINNENLLDMMKKMTRQPIHKRIKNKIKKILNKK